VTRRPCLTAPFTFSPLALQAVGLGDLEPKRLESDIMTPSPISQSHLYFVHRVMLVLLSCWFLQESRHKPNKPSFSLRRWVPSWDIAASDALTAETFIQERNHTHDNPSGFATILWLNELSPEMRVLVKFICGRRIPCHKDERF
jgi:hypothetical protein